MAAKKKAVKAGAGAYAAGKAVRSNTYVQRLVEDDELRDNLRNAFDSARKAYARMSNGKGPAKSLMDDKKVHHDLHTAAESIRDASQQLRGRRTGRRKIGLGKVLLAGIVGAGLVLVLSEDARKAVLDKLFGAEKKEKDKVVVEKTRTEKKTDEARAGSWDCGCSRTGGFQADMCKEEGRGIFGENPQLEVTCCKGDLCNGAMSTKIFASVLSLFAFYMWK